MAKKKKSPTQHTLGFLRKNGWIPWITEVWNPHSKTRRDLYGALDLVAVRDGGRGVLGVQCSSLSGIAGRFKKLNENVIDKGPAMIYWMRSGNPFLLVGWYQTPQGQMRARWIEAGVKDGEIVPVTDNRFPPAWLYGEPVSLSGEKQKPLL